MESINLATLQQVVSTMLSTQITELTYETEMLQGGTVGQVYLIHGEATTLTGTRLPYRLVLKNQKKWERFGDSNSWRREYDLYASDLASTFTPDFHWPACYHAELHEEETHIYMEAIEGVSGLNLTGDMYEKAAYELGKFQGTCLAEKPVALQNITNLSRLDYLKQCYLRYRTWPEVYDYVRSSDCDLPKHLCEMMIDLDARSEEIFEQIETLPVVLCHRDFWVTNIFYVDGKIVLIDWDTVGYGFLGEDIASLIADEADVEHLVEYYDRCVQAYYKGFSEAAPRPVNTRSYIKEMILFMFGYRTVADYKLKKAKEAKALALATLQKIFNITDKTF